MSVAGLRRTYPYRLPAPGMPLRVAFVGHRTLFSPGALHAATQSVTPAFVDTRDDDWDRVMAELAELAPHVIVAFRPQEIPPGAFAEEPCAVLGVAPDPLPRRGGPHAAGLDYNLDQLRRTDRGNVDRVLVCDPPSEVIAAEAVPVWRATPLPVDDRLFAAPRRCTTPPRVLFLGYSTMRVEQWLIGVKHSFDITHFAYGPTGELLAETLRHADVGINLHPEEGLRNLDHRALVHLAAGHLLLSEPFQPNVALEGDIDFIVLHDQHELDQRLHQLAQRPDVYDRVRLRGWTKIQQYRASHAWPALVADLLDDLVAFGAQRGE